MNPKWVNWELVLRPFKKKDCDFRATWHEKCEEAFVKIRTALGRDVVLNRMDHWVAAHPELSGRPLEMFIDASDYAWSATLTQRPAPHKAPKIIAVITKTFLEVQLRWSAMEREL